MKKSALVGVLLLPVLAAAQPLDARPAAPVLPSWNVGAGVGLSFGGLGIYGSTGGGLLGSSRLPYISASPRTTVLFERRLSERVFLTFHFGATYATNQDDKQADLRSHLLSLDGAVGIRRVFNPGGLIEVSWFGSAVVGYSNFEFRAFSFGMEPPPSSLSIVRGHSFGAGAITGLTLERELLSGLALRLSSGILGFSYGKIASTVTTPQDKTDDSSHGFDFGLRFNPSIELRYAF